MPSPSSLGTNQVPSPPGFPTRFPPPGRQPQARIRCPPGSFQAHFNLRAWPPRFPPPGRPNPPSAGGDTPKWLSGSGCMGNWCVALATCWQCIGSALAVPQQRANDVHAVGHSGRVAVWWQCAWLCCGRAPQMHGSAWRGGQPGVAWQLEAVQC